MTFSKADDASAIDNLMLFGKGTSEVGDVERDVEVTSALLNVEKKKRLKALVVVCDVAMILCLSESRTKNGFAFFLTLSLNVVLF